MWVHTVQNRLEGSRAQHHDYCKKDKNKKSRPTSSKFLPVEAGYVSDSLRIFSGLMTYTVRTVIGSPAALVQSGCSMPNEAAIL